jgi:cobalt transporter subunit CbtB|tara:strand:+ start:432 stop:641 length:210 start_codon:yes stop_codon:yes gene_type:complete
MSFGCEGKETTMTTQNITATQTALPTRLVPLFAVALIGFGVVFVAGNLQAETLHDAAHDVRHATGFPCH